MFLRNYDNAMLMMHLCPSITTFYSDNVWNSTGSEFTDNYINQKAPTGAIQSVGIITSQSSSPIFLPPAILATNAICLGTGDTPVAYDDYKMSGDVVPNKLVKVEDTKVYNPETNKWVRTLVATYANTGSTTITIKEWGIFKQLYNYSVTAFSHTAANIALTYREVFDEPIVIEPGKSATITFTMEIPMPNHP